MAASSPATRSTVIRVRDMRLLPSPCPASPSKSVQPNVWRLSVGKRCCARQPDGFRRSLDAHGRQVSAPDRAGEVRTIGSSGQGVRPRFCDLGREAPTAAVVKWSSPLVAHAARRTLVSAGPLVGPVRRWLTRSGDGEDGDEAGHQCHCDACSSHSNFSCSTPKEPRRSRGSCPARLSASGSLSSDGS